MHSIIDTQISAEDFLPITYQSNPRLDFSILGFINGLYLWSANETHTHSEREDYFTVNNKTKEHK